MKTTTNHNSKRSKIVCLVTFFFLFNIYGFSQSQNRTWVVPDKLLSFNPAPTISTLINQSLATTSYNAMQDANGNLLFYVIDGYILDAQGNEIDFISNPNLPGYTVKGHPEVCIVPVPGSCTKYLL